MADNPYVTADSIKSLYEQMQKQSDASTDYAVNQAVTELERAQEDAQKGFRDQRNQVNIDEAQARNNQVLYAAARGDRGGITARQYDSISNTAAKNRQAIAEQQQKLATDTSRQIADLRAQGEFEKANNLLQITQQKMAQLFELQQYEDQQAYNEKQLEMSEAQLTGIYNGKPTYEAEWNQKQWDYNTQKDSKAWAYDVAMQSIQLGVMPTNDVLNAAGLNYDTAKQMAAIYKSARTTTTSSSGSNKSGTSSSSPSVSDQVYKNAKAMYDNGADDSAVWNYLKGASKDENWAKTYAGFLGIEVSGNSGSNNSNNQTNTTTTFSDYSTAVAYMKEKGVPSARAAGAMTRTEWARRKSSYKTYGTGGTEVTAYNSYSEYLTAFVQYCIDTYA